MRCHKSLLVAGVLAGLSAGAPSLLAKEVFIRLDDRVAYIGEDAVLSLVILDGTVDLPDKVEALFVQSGIEYAALLTRMSANGSSGEEGRAPQRATYRLLVPHIMSQGAAYLKLPEPFNSELYLEVQKSHISATAPEADKSIAKELVEEITEAVSDKKETFGSLGGLDVYKPIYFLGGFSPTDAKFQISLKYQLFNDKGRWAQEHPWLTGFHLAYTQVSFWDLSSESKPFEDTNFMPEVFYGIEGIDVSSISDGSELDIQTGFMHESNGRDEFNSRSLNILYGRLSYKHMLGEEWFLRLTGDAWSYVGSLSDNPDIADFRGHSSFRITTGTDKGLQVSAYRRGQIASKKSSYLFDVTVPLKWEGIAKNLNFSLHGQLFTGYGENLLTYDQKETRFRFGLGIHR